MNRVSNYTFVYRDSIFYSALNYNVEHSYVHLTLKVMSLIDCDYQREINIEQGRRQVLAWLSRGLNEVPERKKLDMG